METIFRSLIADVGADAIALMINIDGNLRVHQKINILGAWGRTNFAIEDANPYGRALVQKHTISVNLEEVVRGSMPKGMKVALIIPLIQDSRSLGVLVLYRATSRSEFSAAQITYVSEVAQKMVAFRPRS